MKPDNIMGHSELELSTDNSDDDSLMGEPDSSNLNGSSTQVNQQLGIAMELLKHGSSENNNKILNLFKILVKENTRLKERLQFSEELARKEQERLNRKIIVLQQNRNRNIAASAGSSSSSLSSISSCCSESNSYDKCIVEKPDVIIKPLKKSVRLTSIDEVKHQEPVTVKTLLKDNTYIEDTILTMNPTIKCENL